MNERIVKYGTALALITSMATVVGGCADQTPTVSSRPAGATAPPPAAAKKGMPPPDTKAGQYLAGMAAQHSGPRPPGGYP